MSSEITHTDLHDVGWHIDAALDVLANEPQLARPSLCGLDNTDIEYEVGSWSGECSAAAGRCLISNASLPWLKCTYKSLSSFWQIQQHIRLHGAVVTRITIYVRGALAGTCPPPSHAHKQTHTNTHTLLFMCLERCLSLLLHTIVYSPVEYALLDDCSPYAGGFPQVFLPRRSTWCCIRCIQCHYGRKEVVRT
jgi:hypothetical protein